MPLGNDLGVYHSGNSCRLIPLPSEGIMRLHANLFYLFCLLTLGAWVATLLAKSSLADFGVKENELKQRIVNYLIYGTMRVYPDKRFFKAASPAGQATFVKNALGWVKAYSESAEFKPVQAARAFATQWLRLIEGKQSP